MRSIANLRLAIPHRPAATARDAPSATNAIRRSRREHAKRSRGNGAVGDRRRRAAVRTDRRRRSMPACWRQRRRRTAVHVKRDFLAACDHRKMRPLSALDRLRRRAALAIDLHERNALVVPSSSSPGPSRRAYTTCCAPSWSGRTHSDSVSDPPACTASEGDAGSASGVPVNCAPLPITVPSSVATDACA